ncbi:MULTISPECIES: hypothetical protein [unclassified Streptomyces]|uniref:hypothetical protein n=1 Tax=unclassified Streptomyces TaxID=2593676 RepID=UPI0036FC4694
MREHEAISRMTDVTVLALVAVACAAGLTGILRRRRGRLREGAQGHLGAVRRHTPHGVAAIPRQRRTGPRAEAVHLTAEERDAFAGLVRRFGEGG